MRFDTVLNILGLYENMFTLYFFYYPKEYAINTVHLDLTSTRAESQLSHSVG